jgi:hypothetical protein
MGLNSSISEECCYKGDVTKLCEHTKELMYELNVAGESTNELTVAMSHFNIVPLLWTQFCDVSYTTRSNTKCYC